MKLFKRVFLMLVLGVSMLLAYPNRSVDMIVAYSAGGGTDRAARFIESYLTKYLGQKIVIKNKPGAGGQIGFTALSKSSSDGYTIGFINIPSIFLVEKLRDNVAYKIVDFEPICNIQLDPVVLVVRGNSKFNNLKELISYAKNKGSINIGGDGPSSNNQLQVLLAGEMSGININYISYKGSSPAVKALLSKDIDVAVPSSSSSVAKIEGGSLKALAVFSDDRYKYLPNTPTYTEASGVKVPSVGASLRGLAAPKGISKEHLNVISGACEKALNDSEFLDSANKRKLPIKYLSNTDFKKLLNDTDEKLNEYLYLLK